MVKLIELTPNANDAVIAEIGAVMDSDGYVVLRGLLPAGASRRYGEAILAEHARLIEAGWSFTGGGHIEGHLNIIPGGTGIELVPRSGDRSYAPPASRPRSSPAAPPALAATADQSP